MRVFVCSVVFFILVACGGRDPGRQSNHSSTSTTSAASSFGSVPSQEDFRFDRSRLQVVPNLSDYQRKLLDDGVLTFAEYEASVLAYVGCVEEHGAVVEHVAGDEVMAGPDLNARGQYLFQTTLPHQPGKRATLGELRAIESQCGTEFFDVVVQLWAEHVAPSETELVAARDALGECLREAGVDIPEHPSPTDFGPVAQSLEYRDCSREVSEDFGIPGFGG